ncbi:zinc ribbon domain-containing protein [Clostridium sp. WILCCON 0269]|uniref:Zinc ribbon domain-containing protein n=1 Tax=Candidatus Clostridium eludens TaxID=3381663 RepID=A0ABW8SJ80_9CLOT
MLNLLIQIQDNRERIKKAKKELKNNSIIHSMRKIKGEFENEKVKYKSIDNSLQKIQSNIKDIEQKLGCIKEEMKLEEDKLYRNLKYDLKLINSLEKSIELKQNKIKELEEKSLGLLYEEEELLEQRECSRKRLIELRDDFYDYKKNSNEKVINVKEDIKKAEQDILNCEKCIPSELLSKFNELSSIKGTGAAQLSDGVCLGCKVKVSAITLDNVRNNKGMVYCDNCGRIICYNKASLNK